MWPRKKKPEPEPEPEEELPHEHWPYCFEYEVCVEINDTTHTTFRVQADEYRSSIFVKGYAYFLEYSTDGTEKHIVLEIPAERVVWIREQKRFIPALRKKEDG